MKRKSLVMIAAVFMLAAVSFVVAQTILNIVVVNTTSCVETDKGLDYTKAGNMTGSFWWINATTKARVNHTGTFVDTCLTNSTVLLEGVCGGSISANLSNKAAVAYIDCRTVKGTNGTCLAGRCV